MRNDTDNRSLCPFETALGHTAAKNVDLRPALGVWVGIWSLASAVDAPIFSEFAKVIVHLGGSAAVLIRDHARLENVVLREGEIAAAPPRTMLRLNTQGACTILGVVVEENLLTAGPLPVFARRPGRYGLRFASVAAPHGLYELADLLSTELVNNHSEHVSYRNALVAAFLERLVADPVLAVRHQAAAPFTESRIEKVKQLIEANISQELTVEWLASESGVSPYHLSRKFRETHDVTLRAFITERRLNAACRLLAETRKPLAEIAFDCGFSSQSRMNAVFRKAIDTTPLQYRRLCWETTSETEANDGF